jgi:Holliday junction resolvase
VTRINSRQKGARIERQAAAYLTDLGFSASRMGRNGYSASDLNTDQCPVLSRVHIEVKGDESIKLNTAALGNALAQAERTAAKGLPCCVLWKHNRTGWRLTWISGGVRVTADTDDGIRLTLVRLGIGDLLEGGPT